MIYGKYLKRLFDIIVSIIALVLGGIPLMVSMLLIICSSPGPVFFSQTRVGLRGKPFRILKLRTMTVNLKREIGQTHDWDPAVLPVGKLLRRYKIDELPQILNVIKGDMSFVGPRPCLEETLVEMPEWAKRRLEARPGLTGLAQVNGNICLSWEERWHYDVDYIERMGIWLDMQIVVKTFWVVFFGEERFGKAL